MTQNTNLDFPFTTDSVAIAALQCLKPYGSHLVVHGDGEAQIALNESEAFELSTPERGSSVYLIQELIEEIRDKQV